jgi:hypothetical protein
VIYWNTFCLATHNMQPYRDLVTIQQNKNIRNRIIEYLSARKDKRDELNGLLLAVFGQEIENLTKEILRNVGDLVSEGIIKEEKEKQGEIYYKLVDEAQPSD